MPPQLSAARRTSRARRSATEFGSPDHIALRASGLYQTNTVQDRVKQWQEHGAAAAPAPDAVSVVSAPRSTISNTPEPFYDEDEDQENRIGNRQQKRGKTDHEQAGKANRVRSSSTPRKRIVSDEHWKAGHGSQQDAHMQWIEDQSIDPEMPIVTSPKNSSKTSIQNARKERAERRRRRVESRSIKASEAKRRNPSHADRRASSEVVSESIATERVPAPNTEAESDEATYRNASPISHEWSPSELGGAVTPEHEDDDKPRTRSKYAETLGRAPPTYQDAQLRSKKGKFLNKTKEVLGMTDPIPMTSNRLPSIEAWLEEQPDPFIDNPLHKVRFADEPTEPPKPVKPLSVKRKQPQRTAAPLDPNRIWDSIGKTEAESPTPSIPDGGVNIPQPVEELPPSPVVGIKRSAMKASRPKRHTLANIPQARGQSNQEQTDSNVQNTKNPVQRQTERDGPPSGATRLSTIPSVETLHGQPHREEKPAEPDQQEIKGKVTSHEDMMNVLSRPSLRKSTRRKHNETREEGQVKKDVVKQILEELAEEEAKYSRELRTLVDGVIPVLLQCVLSKSDAVAAAGLFSSSANVTSDLSFSRPIIDMGVTLERLKSLHNRIPLHNVDSLLGWCQTAHKAYSNYLKAWRLGFQDVVINLAPLEGSDGENNEVMARDANGDIVNGNGEKVDVAYLMKRPLVKIRKIGRMVHSLQEALPDHLVAEKIAEDYSELTAAAKTKHQQEKGRLEDEAAASIDVTKCRDIRTMAPLLGVSIDKQKRVRARDCFNLTLFHSTGERMDCKVELILRDNQHNTPDGGDLLICQMEENGKWLLFAPADLSMVSARKGESGSDLVVMIRGRAGLNQEWHELLALKADEPEAISEWMIMVGSNPLPPKLSRVPSFVDIKPQQQAHEVQETNDSRKPTIARVPSRETIDVPIGEPSVLSIIAPVQNELPPKDSHPALDKPLPKLSMGGGLQKKAIPEHWQASNPVIVTRKAAPRSALLSDRSTVSGHSDSSVSTYAPSSLAPMSQLEMVTPLSNKPQPQPHIPARYPPQAVPAPSNNIPSKTQETRIATAESTLKDVKTTEATKELPRIDRVQPSAKPDTTTPNQSIPSREPSSTPSEAAPDVRKVRGASSNVPLTDAIRETWSTISGFGRKAVSQPNIKVSTDKADLKASSPEEQHAGTQEWRKSMPVSVRNASDSAPPQSKASRHSMPPSIEKVEDSPPTPPKHKQILTPTPKLMLRPSDAQRKMDKESGRVPYSSPLRNEYTPSSASNSDESESELSFISDNDSQTSEDDHHEHVVKTTPKVPAVRQYVSQAPVAPPHSAPTTGTRTLAPSDSASQGPYRKVPSSADRPDSVKKKAVAMVCSWNDTAWWEPLIDDYCSIIISPGLMEAFVMKDEQSAAATKDRRPLAAFELTPMVPLRRPTGLDINIRSPPTSDSQIMTSNNIMFRSRSATECEALYQMINWARCNNPTYIELERSRPRPQPTVTFSNQEAPRPRSWFSFGGINRRNSYRVGNFPPSSMGESQATANSTSSAMSALRRLTKSSSFNVNRSSVVRRPGLGTNASLYSSSNGTGAGSGSSTPQPSQLGLIPGKDGPNVPPTSAAAVDGGGMVHNMRIRLQVRQSSGWVTMGFSRLTILPAVKRNENSPEDSRPPSSGSNTVGGEGSRRTSTTTGPPESHQRHIRLPSSHYTPHRMHGGGREKRVVVTSDKDPSHVLLTLRWESHVSRESRSSESQYRSGKQKMKFAVEVEWSSVRTPNTSFNSFALRNVPGFSNLLVVIDTTQ